MERYRIGSPRNPRGYVRAHALRRLLHTLAIASCALVGTSDARRAQGQGNEDPLPSPLELRDVMRIARERHPEVLASIAEAEAAEARPAIVGSLSDPSVTVTLEHLPFPVMGADVQAMATQSVPLSRVLRFRRRGAAAEARRRRSAVARTELDVALEAARAFFMVYERRRRVSVLEAQIELAEQITESATARHGAGQGFAADVLRAESEAARLAAELAALRASVRGAEAMLGARLARDPGLGIPELAVPEFLDARGTTPALERLIGRALEERPELEGGEAAIERAEAET
ncbi:MAG: TolC family protein, partial [Polyangiaceae bacterium]|nr:TolC family protein [Polyangiaceae bacterium]